MGETRRTTSLEGNSTSGGGAVSALQVLEMAGAGASRLLTGGVGARIFFSLHLREFRHGYLPRRNGDGRSGRHKRPEMEFSFCSSMLRQ